jgi:hypothetical protein
VLSSGWIDIKSIGTAESNGTADIFYRRVTEVVNATSSCGLRAAAGTVP